ncbi:MAG: response regulator, partial [Lentisphaerota bacterium]
MTKENILVVEDDADIQELVRYNLGKDGYKVSCMGTGEGGLKGARALLPDLILLDLMLPGLDGLEVCRHLKNDLKTRHIPVIMLTAKGEEADVVAGLELGADDYVSKPFSPRVLMARIKAVLRRHAKESSVLESRPIKSGDLLIDPGRHEASIKGKALPLTYTEFRVLHFLAQRPGWVFTR